MSVLYWRSFGFFDSFEKGSPDARQNPFADCRETTRKAVDNCFTNVELGSMFSPLKVNIKPQSFRNIGVPTDSRA